MAILQSEDHLVCTTTPGDVGEWALVSNQEEFLFRSVAYFKHRVFTLCDNGSLVRIDFNGSITTRAEFVASHPMREYVGYPPSHEHTWYRHKKISSESLEWEPVWSIGDKAFFVGSGNSCSISLAHTVNCNSNSIFYGDDTEGGLGLDNGIYDLETWQIESLRFGAEVPRSQPQTTWITPSLTPSTFR
uniref:KIB1-4 beta-propeller domain-containing protein n=1 Tax=Ficus carica TaxID=3494 RepID=A0AA88EGD4_FICCA|nr:hypothetical protein TIFTF001_054003 [Ficus carica]GMN70891.1 hypothetical protein TIFTF001_054007 [Ficus carica]